MWMKHNYDFLWIPHKDEHRSDHTFGCGFKTYHKRTHLQENEIK